MSYKEIKASISRKFPGSVIGENLEANPFTLLVDSKFIREICGFLHAHESTYFDSLSCLTGIDNGEEAGTMEVIYHLYSIPHNIHLGLVVELDRDHPKVDSVSEVWAGANWHEREAYDLLGIRFENHPDLRRILLPSDWEGHPLKKDYQEQENYHGIKVKY